MKNNSIDYLSPKLLSSKEPIWINPVGGMGDIIMLSTAMMRSFEKYGKKFSMARRTQYTEFFQNHPAIEEIGHPPVGSKIVCNDYWKRKEFKNTKFESIPPNHRLVKRMREFDGVDVTPDPCMIPSIRRAVVGRITPMKVCDGAAKIAVVTNRLDSADARPLDEVIEDVSMHAWVEHQNTVVKRLKDEWKTGIPIITKMNVFSEKER